jgi:hypothetical protein
LYLGISVVRDGLWGISVLAGEVWPAMEGYIIPFWMDGRTVDTEDKKTPTTHTTGYAWRISMEDITKHFKEICT